MIANGKKLLRESVQDIIDLTPIQEGLLFHYLKDPGGVQYHEQLCLNITGNINLRLFQLAWEQVVQSNEMLRTVFRWRGLKKPVQIILKQATVKITYVDFSHLEPSEQTRHVEEMKQTDYKQSFDLSDIAFRLTVCTLSEQRCTLIISNHHILYDGWSNGIILSEFFAHYQQLQNGMRPSIPAKTPFKTYYMWLQGQDHQRQMQFWRTYLQGFHTRTSLPIKQTSETTQKTPASHKVVCPAEVKQQLETFCRKHQVTQSAVLYAAFGLVLQKYHSSNDVVFGATVSGRTADIADMLHLVGLFINTVPLRVHGTQEQRLLDVVRQVNASLAARIPFEVTPLVDIRSASELEAQDDLFDALMVIENYPLDQQLLNQSASLRISDFSLREMTNYDLTVMVNLLFDTLELHIIYVKERFNEAAIVRLSDGIFRALKTIIQNPEQRLDEMEIVSAEEKHQILSQFNATSEEFAADTTLHRLFAQQVEKYAQRPALLYEGQVLTYQQLDEQSSRLASYLLRCGVENETIVGICSERSLDMMVGLFAILKAGGVYLPLDPRIPEKRIHSLLEDSGAKMVLCQDKFQALIDSNYTVIKLEAPELYSLPPTDYTKTGRPENLAYVLYTSGSTGKPKGVLIEHRSIINRLSWAQRYLHLHEEDIILQKTNIMFDVSVWELFGWLFAGAALCLLRPGAEADPSALIETVARAQVTTIHFVPSMFQLFLDYLQQHQAGAQLQSLQRILTSGEALRTSQVTQSYALLPQAQLTNLYGPTEATIDVSYYPCSPHNGDRENVPIGKPIDNIRLYVLNQSHTLQPIGVPGELFIAGVGVARGYINASELTAQRFLPDPFYPKERMYASGDLVRWLPNGNLEYLGRLDHQVKIRGFRVELPEIEARLLQFPQIKEAIVIAAKDSAQDDRLIAYIVPHQHAEIDGNTIRKSLATQLPDFMLPDIYRELTQFPLTHAGKVDRNKLLQMAFENKRDQPHQSISELELNTIERTVSAIWADVLGIEQIQPDDVFFEVGGNSLKIIRVCSHIMSELQVDIPVTALFQYPTIRTLARFIATKKRGEPKEIQASSPSRQEPSNETASCDVAVIGMAGRFPGAQNIAEFWDNLSKGIESISFLSDETLRDAGVPAHLLENPRYVRAKGVLEGVENFDAEFFGYSPREALVMDPQLRILHQSIWEALEDAGYNPETYAGAIGLFAGSSPNFHWLQQIARHSTSPLDEFSLMLLNEKDFLSSRIAYKMNLRGPSVTIQTACSTSLATLHYAYQSLLNNHCNIAVAAGVSVTYPVKAGYLYEEGMVFSPDGHCRAFDAQAQGTVGGNGVGAVVLKRLEDALQQGDHIYAVIKGSAINNDGFHKVGFTAPGIDGQAQVIAAAQAMAGVAPESITYVETHGTGTELGDPIELEALTQAFKTEKQHFCAIGSVKTNIGHLDTAAGIAGFVKTALALKHAQLPPSLHFERPNPKSNLAQSPFHVITRLSPWQRGETPLRAGVSSFGMGGTNVHMVLEEPPKAVQQTNSTDWQIIPLSARTATSLQVAGARLRAHLQSHSELNLADVAYTLQVGRKPFAHRSFVVCSTLKDVLQQIHTEGEQSENEEDAFLCVRSAYTQKSSPDVTFFFPGQGSQYVNMGAGLYQSVVLFKETVDHCFDLLHTMFHLDIRAILYPEDGSRNDSYLINQTEYTQPLLFIYEYALAQLLTSWGIRPTAMIGHSLGEYVAACLAGVFSLADALKLVVGRARLMQKLPQGSMISVSMAEQELRYLLPDHLSIAAVNSRSSCVVSGPTEAIEVFTHELKERGYSSRSLVTSHAFHSSMMEPMLNDFYQIASQVTFRKPHVPFISNSSGTWIQNHEATNPYYWVNHLRSSVRFSDGVELLVTTRPGIFLEVGPGRTLTALVKKCLNKDADVSAMNLSRHPLEQVSDTLYLFHRLGELWLQGVTIDWEQLHLGQQRKRVSLPTYVFEAQRFWPDKPLSSPASVSSILMDNRQKDIADWFSVPSWERSEVPVYTESGASQSSWIIFALRNSFCEAFMRELRNQGANVNVIYVGEQFAQVTDYEYIVHPRHIDDFKRALSRIKEVSGIPNMIVHLWSSAEDRYTLDAIGSIIDEGFYTLLNLSRVLGALQMKERIKVIALTSGIEQVTGYEHLCPAKATMYGFTKLCQIEYPSIACRAVDFDPEEIQQGDEDELVRNLIAECLLSTSDEIIAYRGGYRWNKVIRSSRIETSLLLKRRLRTGGVYLITGGLGGIGFALATFLCKELKPTLALVTRSAFPVRETWQRWLEDHGAEDRISQKILNILQLEEQGSHIAVYTADVANKDQIERVVYDIEQHYGLINGVVHAAGVADYAGMIQVRSDEATAAILAPKVQGTIMLDHLINQRELDFFVLCSSIGNVIYQQKFGQSGYNAANEFLDAYAHYRRKQGRSFWVSINWSDWQEVGMSLVSATYWSKRLAVQTEEILADGMTNAEGIEVFRRILSGTHTQVFVSPQALAQRASKAVARFQTLLAMPQTSDLQTSSDAPSQALPPPIDDLEDVLAHIWQKQVGVASVDLHENFFDLGTDSLDLVQANAVLRERFKIEVPLVALYEHPNIASLARFIRTELYGNAIAPAAPANTKGSDKTKSLLKYASARMKKK